MQTADSILKRIKDDEVQFVDLRFTDPRGKWHHVSYDLSMVDADFLNNGTMFDGSSIAGWRAINDSDMILVPDLDTAVIDPFFSMKTLILVCNVVEPATGQRYGRCPRSVAQAAEKYLTASGIGEKAYFGPEAEFFVFDSARFDVQMNKGYYYLESSAAPYSSGEEYPLGNMGHRPAVKGGYFPVPPVDQFQDLRSDMLAVMGEMGIHPEKHHHEVAGAQHELGFKFGTLTHCADATQILKYVVHMTAQAAGKTATFMPKPIYGDNGSGMHVHQSLWKENKPLFAGSSYADLSDTCLHYIGGIIKHAKAINAFSNPTTNSYKRLIPGFEAPVLLAYSSRNRSASCRIPYSPSPKGKRVEVRFPDPGANPYFAFAAMLMAGLDGIEKKIHPGNPMDKDLYSLPPEELRNVPQVCGSLREALENLSNDRAFLKSGGVFNDDLIDSYIELKMEEVYQFEHTPHPVEFKMYYSV
jgi:glutamine synthetase